MMGWLGLSAACVFGLSSAFAAEGIHDSPGQRLATCADEVKGTVERSQNGTYRTSVPKGAIPATFVETEATLGRAKADIPLADGKSSYALLARARMKNLCGLPQYVVRRNPTPAPTAGMTGRADAPEAAYYERTIEKIDASPAEMDKIMRLIEAPGKAGVATMGVRVKWGEKDDVPFELTCATDPSDRSSIDSRGQLRTNPTIAREPVEANLSKVALKEGDPEVAMLEAQVKALFAKRGQEYLAKLDEDLKRQLALIRSEKNTREMREQQHAVLQSMLIQANVCRAYMTNEQIAKLTQMVKPATAVQVPGASSAAGSTR